MKEDSVRLQVIAPIDACRQDDDEDGADNWEIEGSTIIATPRVRVLELIRRQE